MSSKTIKEYFTILEETLVGTFVPAYTFEHLIILELTAYLDYTESNKRLSFWHTQNNAYEVDAIIGNAEWAIEIKSSASINTSHLKGLKAFQEEHQQCKLIVVSQEERPRLLSGVEIWPAAEFLSRLWKGKIIN